MAQSALPILQVIAKRVGQLAIVLDGVVRSAPGWMRGFLAVQKSW